MFRFRDIAPNRLISTPNLLTMFVTLILEYILCHTSLNWEFTTGISRILTILVSFDGAISNSYALRGLQSSKLEEIVLYEFPAW